jgi:Tfp pilus assembly protein PilN
MILTAANIIVAFALLRVTQSSNSDKETISTLQSQLESQRKEIKQLQLLKSDTIHYVLHYPLVKKEVKKK